MLIICFLTGQNQLSGSNCKNCNSHRMNYSWPAFCWGGWRRGKFFPPFLSSLPPGRKSHVPALQKLAWDNHSLERALSCNAERPTANWEHAQQYLQPFLSITKELLGHTGLNKGVVIPFLGGRLLNLGLGHKGGVMLQTEVI